MKKGSWSLSQDSSYLLLPYAMLHQDMVTFPRMTSQQVALRTTESYVRSIYGEPDEISYDSNRLRAGPINRKTFRYGSTFFVVFNIDHRPEDGSVWEVKSTGNNGLKTPVGFTVGMNLSDVRKYYGQGRGDENHLAYNANWHNIMFTAKNGKITEIRIYPTP